MSENLPYNPATYRAFRRRGYTASDALYLARMLTWHAEHKTYIDGFPTADDAKDWREDADGFRVAFSWEWDGSPLADVDGETWDYFDEDRRDITTWPDCRGLSRHDAWNRAGLLVLECAERREYNANHYGAVVFGHAEKWGIVESVAIGGISNRETWEDDAYLGEVARDACEEAKGEVEATHARKVAARAAQDAIRAARWLMGAH